MQPPDVVYQTWMENGRQDSSTPLTVELSLAHAPELFRALSDAVARGEDARASRKVKASVAGHVDLGDVSAYVTGVLRRFDGREVELWDDAHGCMQGLRLPPACFTFTLTSVATVRVHVHRKYLPVSKCHGNAPFLFAFVITPPSGTPPLVVCTHTFMCASKEPTSAAERAAPKRVRNPPSSKPVAAPPSGADGIVNDFFAGRAPSPAGRPADVPAAAAEPQHGEADAGCVSGKRGRGDSPALEGGAPRKRPLSQLFVDELPALPAVPSSPIAAALTPLLFGAHPSHALLPPPMLPLSGSMPFLRDTSLGALGDAIDSLPTGAVSTLFSFLPLDRSPRASPALAALPSWSVA